MKYISEHSKIQKVGNIAVNTDYIQSHNATEKNGRNVSYIVMHYTGNSKDTALNNAKYFKNNNLSSSAHYFVDENEIYQSVELKNKAWHTGTKGTYYSSARNENSIGIEMCCSGNYIVSDKTQENSAKLCAMLCNLIGIDESKVDTFVLRHYDVTHKKCPLQWVNDEKEFIIFKQKVKSLLKKEPFTDISGHWAENAIKSLYNDGLITGYNDNSFRPDNFVTRAELCAIIQKIGKA